MGIIDTYLKNIQNKSNSNGMQPAVNTYEPLKTTNAIAAPRSSAQEASTGGRSMSDIQERTFPKDEQQKGTQAYSSLQGTQGQPPAGPSTGQQIWSGGKQAYDVAKLGNKAYNALGLGVPTAAEAALTASTPEAAFILNDMGAATAAGYSGGAEMGAAVGAEIGTEAAGAAVGEGVGATVGAIGSAASTVVGIAAPYYAAAKLGGMAINAITDANPSMKPTPFGRLGEDLRNPLQVESTWADRAQEQWDVPEWLGDAWAIGSNPINALEKFGIGTVICTELHRQGLLPDDIYAADCEYEKLQDNDLMDGYRLWGAPLAGKMKNNKLLTKCVSFFAVPWAHQMSYEMGVGDKGSLFGKALITVMYPPVRLIGKIRHYQILMTQRGLY